jgi:hypothetical protein
MTIDVDAEDDDFDYQYTKRKRDVDQTRECNTGILMITDADNSYTPLQEDTVDYETLEREAKRPKTGEWTLVTIGVGKIQILHDAVTGLFKCPTEGCDYQHKNGPSVIMHHVRHRIKIEPDGSCCASSNTVNTLANLASADLALSADEEVILLDS